MEGDIIEEIKKEWPPSLAEQLKICRDDHEWTSKLRENSKSRLRKEFGFHDLMSLENHIKFLEKKICKYCLQLANEHTKLIEAGEIKLGTIMKLHQKEKDDSIPFNFTGKVIFSNLRLWVTNSNKTISLRQKNNDWEIIPKEVWENANNINQNDEREV